MSGTEPIAVRNLIPQFIHDRYLSGERCGSFDAYALFVDMSGFTGLTAHLMAEGRVGAERLSILLNGIFGPMVHHVYRYGGFIPHFAGDSFTAIFPVSGGSTAAAVLSHAMRLPALLEAVPREPDVPFDIRVKVGLSYGHVEWGIVGGEGKAAYYFRGSAIMGSAAAQLQARQQEVVADAAFRSRTAVGGDHAWESLPVSGYFRVSGRVSETMEGKEESGEAVGQRPEVLAVFLPADLVCHHPKGEFRNVVSVFLSFEGLGTHEALDSFATGVLEEVHNFSGYFKEIDFGDKGGVMVIFFGAPVSYENNVARALGFLSAVRGGWGQQVSLKAGVTEGMTYTGMIGGAERFQYAVVGNQVNLAARLMMQAEAGEVLVDEAIQKNREYRFYDKGAIYYKGIPGAIPTFGLSGREALPARVFEGEMVGREKELSALLDFSTGIIRGVHAGVAVIYGEAGAGKTRLVHEFRRQLESRGQVYWYTCHSDQILRKPFNPFLYLLRNHFGQRAEDTAEQNLRHFDRIFTSMLATLDSVDRSEWETFRRELVRTRSILATLVGLKVGDSLWDRLDAKGRHQNTIAALTNFFLSSAISRPVVVCLEDGHWTDESSVSFLNELSGQVRQYPVLFLVTTRYDDEGGRMMPLAREVLSKHAYPILELDLNLLDQHAVRRFSEERLGGPVQRELMELLLRTTGGNPFYVEQMLEYFMESGQLQPSETGWTLADHHVRISSSIQSVLTARIDRLSALVKETIKAAAVIGREFDLPVLSEVMRGYEAVSTDEGRHSGLVLKEQVREAERAQIWRAVNELRYIFRHALLREAVYDMQLDTQLRTLHRLIARAIENLYADRLAEHYVDLVFHYEHAGDISMTERYLEKAADHARDRYQNNQALSFYGKLGDIRKERGDTAALCRVLLKKAEVWQLTGEWEACEDANRQALRLAAQVSDGRLMGMANSSLGYMLILRGKHGEARRFLDEAAVLFSAIQDGRGNAKVYGYLGTLHFRQGEYEEAKLYFTRGIQLSGQFGHMSSNAQIVANLGLTYMNLGKYDEGIRWMAQYLDQCGQAQDRQGMAVLLTNLGIVHAEKGDHDAALECYEKGLSLSEELGDKQLTAIAIGCIGTIWQRKGDMEEARRHFERDLVLTEELGDRQGQAIAHGLLGELYSDLGMFGEARRHLGEALEMSRSLSYAKGAAKALNVMGDISFLEGDSDRAVAFYDQAIEVTRSIHNRLLLGYNLVEKATVLLVAGHISEAAEQLREARRLSDELNHDDLRFEVDLADGQVTAAEGRVEAAAERLLRLLPFRSQLWDLSRLHRELYRMTADERHRDAAVRCLGKAYAQRPVFRYRQAMEQLRNQRGEP
ncbi:MAG: hypothetical protein RLY31_2656 [Bacteroidota bacterium]